jgi:hypothetical protein
MDDSRASKTVENELVSSERDVLGQVEVDGATYGLQRAGIAAFEIVRCSDGRPIGRLRGSPTLMWLLEADGVDAELLRDIVRSAIQEGLLVDLPTD